MAEAGAGLLLAAVAPEQPYELFPLHAATPRLPKDGKEQFGLSARNRNLVSGGVMGLKGPQELQAKARDNMAVVCRTVPFNRLPTDGMLEDMDRIGKILDLGLTEIPKDGIDLAADFVVNLGGYAYAAGAGQRFQSGGEVDAVAEEIAFFDDYITQVYPDSKDDALQARCDALRCWTFPFLYPPWSALGKTDLTEGILQKRLDEYAIDIARRLR